MVYRVAILFVTLCLWGCEGLGPVMRSTMRTPANVGDQVSCRSNFGRILGLIRQGKPQNPKWPQLAEELKRGEVSSVGGEFKNALARLYETLDDESQTLIEKRLLSLDNFQRKKLRWRIKKRTPEQEVEDLLDAIYRVSYAKINLLSVYRFSRGRFTRSSVEAYSDLLFIKHAALGDSIANFKLSSIPSRLSRTTLTLFSFFLPVELGRVGIRFNKRHLKILKESGHKGLYKHIKRTHGNLKALKYWFVHLTNVKLVATIGLLAFVGPEIYESQSFWSDLLKVEIDENADIETLEQIISDKELNSEQLKTSLITLLDSSDSSDAQDLKEFLMDLED